MHVDAAQRGSRGHIDFGLHDLAEQGGVDDRYGNRPGGLDDLPMELYLRVNAVTDLTLPGPPIGV